MNFYRSLKIVRGTLHFCQKLPDGVNRHFVVLKIFLILGKYDFDFGAEGVFLKYCHKSVSQMSIFDLC